MLQSKSALTLVIVSLFAVLPAEAVCFKRTLTPKTNDVFEFTTTLIDSFTYAKEALAASEAPTENPEILGQLVESIYQLRLAEEKYSCAAEIVAPYEKSSVQAVALSARGTTVIFKSLALLE